MVGRLKKFLQFVIVLGYIQLLMAEKVGTETTGSEHNLNQELLQLEPNASTTLKSSSEDIKLPYGITINKHRQENEDLSHNEKYTIAQNGKVIDVLEDYYIYDVFDGDMDKDGVRELIFKTYSGGAHCCFDLFLIQIEPRLQKSLILPMNNAENVEFKDLDDDGINEWILWDDHYSYFADFCFACSPGLKIVTSYRKGTLTLRPDLMQKHKLNKKEPMSRFKVGYHTYEGKNYLTMAQESGRIGFERFLFYFYLGKYKEGIEVLQQYAYFDGETSKKLFFKKFVERASQSYFWKQLKEINFGKNALSDGEVQVLLERSLKIEWIDPTAKVCKAHGGEYDAKQGVCSTYEDKIDETCRAAGGRIPTLHDMEHLVTGCGAELTYHDGLEGREAQIEENKKNVEYQNCYQKKGFRSKGGYWTATAHSFNDRSLIYVYFDDGSFDWYDGWREKIRCIKK